MKRNLLFLILVIGLPAFSQNWAPINTSERFCYSSDDDLEIINNVLWVDSVQNHADFNRIFLNTTVEHCDTCSNPNLFIRSKSQFLLKQIDAFYNGDWLFYDDIDTFLIKKNGDVGDSWIFNQQQNIVAEIIEVESMDIFNVLDMVKIIVLSDNSTILLSMNHGIVNWRNQYQLIGIEERELGIHVPKFEDMFSELNEGDVLYVYQYSFFGWAVYEGYEWESDTNYYIYDIQDISISSDTVIINVNFNRRHQYNFMFTWYPYEYFSGNTNLIFTKNGFTESFPNTYGEYEITNYASNGSENVITEFINHEWKGKVKTNVQTDNGTTTFYPVDNFLIPYWDWVRSKIHYSLSFGVHEYYNAYQIPYGGGAAERKLELQGVINDGDTLGTIFPIEMFVGTNQLTTNSNYLVYPNPAKDHINLHSSQNGIMEYQIFNYEGVLVKNSIIDKKDLETQIQISDLSSGAYFIKLIQNDHIEVLKFVKK